MSDRDRTGYKVKEEPSQPEKSDCETSSRQTHVETLGIVDEISSLWYVTLICKSMVISISTTEHWSSASQLAYCASLIENGVNPEALAV
jgi:hypothetical protein